MRNPAGSGRGVALKLKVYPMLTTPLVPAEAETTFAAATSPDTSITQPPPEVDWNQITAYLDMHFRYVELNAGYAIMPRGIGESGTPQEGVFRENLAVPLCGDSDEIGKLLAAAQRWGAHRVATFMVPAAMDGSILEDGKGTENRVRLFTT